MFPALKGPWLQRKAISASSMIDSANLPDSFVQKISDQLKGTFCRETPALRQKAMHVARHQGHVPGDSQEQGDTQK